MAANLHTSSTATTIPPQNCTSFCVRPKQDYTNVAYSNNVMTSTSNNNDYVSDASLMRTCEHNDFEQSSTASRPPGMFQSNTESEAHYLKEVSRRRRRNSFDSEANFGFCFNNKQEQFTNNRSCSSQTDSIRQFENLTNNFEWKTQQPEVFESKQHISLSSETKQPINKENQSVLSFSMNNSSFNSQSENGMEEVKEEGQVESFKACSLRVSIKLPNKVHKVIIFQRPKLTFAATINPQ